MSPTEQIAALTARIESLERLAGQIGESRSIPRNIETAFTERLAIANKLEASGTGSPAATTSFSAFPVIVPANPSHTLAVSALGATHFLLCA